MAIAFGAAGALAASISGTTTPAFPSGVAAGHLLITEILNTGTGAISAPAGWNPYNSVTGTAGRTWAFWRFYEAGDTAPGYATAVTGGFGVMTRWTGVPISADPFDIVAATAGTATGTSASLAGGAMTTNTANAMVIWIFAQYDNHTHSAPNNSTSLAYSLNSTTGNDGSLSVAYKLQASAGATGSTTMTSSGSAEYGVIRMALRDQDIRTGSPSATAVTLAASAAGGKSLTRSQSATAMTLDANRTGQKIGVGAPTAALTLSASVVGGRYIARSVSATDLTLAASALGCDVVPVSASPMTLSATRVGTKIGVGAATATAVSLAGSATGFKRGIGHPTPDLVLGASLSDTDKIGGEPVPVTIPPMPPITHPLRLMAQDILTKKWLDWDLPVSDVMIEYNLSGPELITGYFNPEIKSIRDLGMDAWATYIHAEIDGQIRASGILQPVKVDEERLSFEAMGPSGYGHGIPYLGAEYAGIQVDPLDIVRTMWAHVQSFPEGNIGLILDSTTSPVRLGEPETEKRDEDGQIVYKKDDQGNITDEPEMEESKPYTLMWWDLVDIGSEIDNLAKATPFDYYDEPVWNANRTDVIHKLRLAYPRKGTRRFDLRFCQGENILDLVPAQEKDDTFASAVIIIGSGEGRDAVRGYTGERYLNRLRRVAFSTQKSIKTVQAANALAQEELLSRRGKMLEFSSIIVDAQHANAKVGEYQTGDDIFIQVDVPWLGDLGIWHRIVSYSYNPTRELVTMNLARSDSFRYGSSI